MKGNKAKNRAEAAMELELEQEQGVHLVKAPGAMESDPSLTLPKLAAKTEVRVSTSTKLEIMQE